jgi:hypothetical protein
VQEGRRGGQEERRGLDDLAGRRDWPRESSGGEAETSPEMGMAATSSVEVRPENLWWRCRVLGFQGGELVGNGLRIPKVWGFIGVGAVGGFRGMPRTRRINYALIRGRIWSASPPRNHAGVTTLCQTIYI